LILTSPYHFTEWEKSKITLQRDNYSCAESLSEI